MLFYIFLNDAIILLKQNENESYIIITYEKSLESIYQNLILRYSS